MTERPNDPAIPATGTPSAPTPRTALVATIGGHISELVELADRLPGDDTVWITSDTAQTRDLLAGRTVEYVPFIGERDLAGVARAVPQAARLLRRHRVERVISTGSAIALAYLPVAAALGLETHYIESSTRVESCSVTGRLLSRVPGIRCWWQYEPAPERFRSVPGVYAHYRSEPAPTGAALVAATNGRTEEPTGGRTEEPAGDQVPIERVVVTVGTTDRCFRRLIERLVEILPAEAEVLWQTGHSEVGDLGIDARRLVPEAELVAAVARADVVISHAGAGSLALALAAGTCPVFVPRRAAHDEQIDDHQVELARWADGRGLAVAVEADEIEPTDLQRAAARRIIPNPTEELVLT